MKRFLVIFLSVFLPVLAWGQENPLLTKAQELFAAGDYPAAVEKYQECVKKLDGKDKRIAQMQLVSAQSCATAMANAKAAMSAKDYDKAISEYQVVVDTNPGDTNAKKLIEAARTAKREANPSLSVSKTSLYFPYSGGTQTITVNCSMTWEIGTKSSSLITLTRNGNDIAVSCSASSSYSANDMYFIVKTTNGVKQQRISITQDGMPYSASTTLSVDPTDISVSSSSGTYKVYVSTNANSYDVSLLPSWCKVQSKYSTYFILSYTANDSSSYRKDWFNVKAGDKTVKVNIKQNAGSSSSSYGSSSGSGSYSSRSSKSSVSYRDRDPFIRFGLDASLNLFSDSLEGFYGGLHDTVLGGGIGVRVRFGRPSQFLNLITGVRYAFGEDFSGVMIPALLNLNLVRFDDYSFYLGGGYEFGLGKDYPGGFMAQLGFNISHFDSMLYLQFGDGYAGLGLGFTYYF